MSATTGTATSTVSVRRLHDTFRTTSVLHDVELQLGVGEFVALLGVGPDAPTSNSSERC
jgi:ABC-type lipopolysaccharide export system ATPase subunit